MRAKWKWSSLMGQRPAHLLLGAGGRRDKDIGLPWCAEEWGDLTTLDYNSSHNPSVVHDLEVLPYPFPSDTFDEIHAYDVLEHTGTQGDWKFFFDQFAELWRILKPGGLLAATCPSYSSEWAWGDPSHKRIINAGTLSFLSQKEYARQVGVTKMSDFRFYWKKDFDIVACETIEPHFCFVLRKK